MPDNCIYVSVHPDTVSIAGPDSVIENNTLTLTCNPSAADPTHSLTHGLIPQGGTHNEQTLTVTDVSVSQAGPYSCTGENTIQYTTETCEVKTQTGGVSTDKHITVLCEYKVLGIIIFYF